MAHKFACEHCGEMMVLRAVGPLGKAMCRACGQRTAVPAGVVPVLPVAAPSSVPRSAADAKVGDIGSTPPRGAKTNSGPVRWLAWVQFPLVIMWLVPAFYWVSFDPWNSAMLGMVVWISWLIRGALFAVADGLDDIKAVRRSLDR